MIDEQSLVQEKQIAPARCIQVWTIQMGKWRLAAEKKIQMLDITAKALSPFAPEYAEVMKHKAGETSEDRYTELYLERLRASLRHNPAAWEQLKQHPQVAIACYCGAWKFCHRHIFLSPMTKYLAREGYTVQRMGELT